MPMVQHADQGHQLDAGFRKDQRVERSRVVLGKEHRLNTLAIAAVLRRLGNDARRWLRERLGSWLPDVLSRVAELRGKLLRVSGRGYSQIRQQVRHFTFEGLCEKRNP